jgi:hypothetical protein
MSRSANSRSSERDETLAFACGALCLEIGAVANLDILSPPVFTVVDKLHPENDLVTWLVEGGRFLILLQSAGGTRVYDTEDDFLYYATPHTQLSADCPVGHAFLCQTVRDREADGSRTLRLLVTDLVSPRIECPVRRGEALRGMAQYLPSVCHVQWAGNHAALKRFVEGGSVPHRVGGLMAMRAPLVFAREPVTGIAALDAFACLS